MGMYQNTKYNIIDNFQKINRNQLKFGHNR